MQRIGKKALVSFSNSRSVRGIAGFQKDTKKVTFILAVGFKLRKKPKTNLLLNVSRD